MRRNQRIKKKYSTANESEFFKNVYERNIKKLKEEHDNYVNSLYISNTDSKNDNSNDKTNISTPPTKQYMSPEQEKEEERIKKELDRINKLKTNSEYMVIALMEAEKLWLAVKIASINSGSFLVMSDEEKIDMVHKDFAEFHNNFPIVTKYMVCKGQYNQTAFKKFLKLCEERLSNAPSDRKKGYMEEQWIECQAQYVKYLWESIQVKRHTTSDARKVYQEAYRTLTNDFKRFKKLHEDSEARIKKDKLKHTTELLKEAGSRIVTGAQSLELTRTRDLVNKLRDKKYKQNSDRTIQQLRDTVKFIPPKYVSLGKDEQAQMEYEYELKQANTKKNYKPMSLFS